MTNLLNNELICLISVCLITGIFIKSYFFAYSTVIETPPTNSPPTFNFNHEQLQEIQDLLEQGEEFTINKETQDKLDSDFKNILGKENYEQFNQEIQEIENDFANQLQDILNNEILNINCPLELHSWDLTLLLIYIIGFIITIKFFKMMVLYNRSLLIPFSSFDIDFRDSFEWKFDSYRVKPEISYLKLQTLTRDIIKLLDSLEDNENYSMGLSFISSYKEWQDNKEKVHPLFIDNAIIINKESDPLLITQFIMDTLDSKGYFITNWLFKDSSINSMDPVILTVTVRIKVKI